MTQIAFIHIALEIWGSIFCLIAALCLALEKSLSPKENQLIIRMQLTNAILLIFDSLAWFFRGHIGTLGYYMVRISNFMVFASTYVLILCITQYIAFHCQREKEDEKVSHVVHVIYLVCFIAIVLLVISQFTDFYYAFDEQNRYYRKDPYWICIAIGAVGMLLDTFVVVWKRKYLSKLQYIAFLSYMVLPLLSAGVQVFLYGIQLMNLAITISLMIMFFTFQVECAKRYVKQEEALHQAEIELMMSQIRPHFLFNSLHTIKHLCRRKPEEAIEAIDEFSDFLRGSMGAVGKKECIPFREELGLVNNYLYLEKKRFGEQLHIVYHITAEEFKVPALSMQPFVENAVKHGIRGKIGGGTITISTAEDETDFYVDILDDGVGFDISVPQEDGRSHVGMQNASNRLQMMCHAQVKVDSKPGEGTKVTIAIPKEKHKI